MATCFKPFNYLTFCIHLIFVPFLKFNARWNPRIARQHVPFRHDVSHTLAHRFKALSNLKNLKLIFSNCLHILKLKLYRSHPVFLHSSCDTVVFFLTHTDIISPLLPCFYLSDRHPEVLTFCRTTTFPATLYWQLYPNVFIFRGVSVTFTFCFPLQQSLRPTGSFFTVAS